MGLAQVHEGASAYLDGECGAIFAQINCLALERVTSLDRFHILCHQSMMLRVDNVGAMKAQKLLIGVAMHAACGGIGFDNEAIHVSDDQSIVAGFKDATVLLFLFAQLFFGLHALSDVAYYRQPMKFPFIGERGCLPISMECSAIFAPGNKLGMDETAQGEV